ncbi:MAG: hypothetical protein AAFM91_19575, partial [Pseudomonadota bacterium]
MLETAQGGALDGSQFGVEREDLDTPAEAIGLVGVALVRDVETLVECVPAVAEAELAAGSGLRALRLQRVRLRLRLERIRRAFRH